MKPLFANFQNYALIALLVTAVSCRDASIKSDAAKSNSDKTAVSTDAETAIDPSAVPPPSRERILESFSYLQLSQAAAAYKILEDESLGRGPEITAPNIFGCVIDKVERKSAQSILHELIDAKMAREQTSYLRGTKVFLKTRGSSECEKSCTCGAILDVLSSVDVRVLNRAERSRHEELLLELQSKSSRQGPDATMECAQQQKWICKSDLQKYLKSHLSSKP